MIVYRIKFSWLLMSGMMVATLRAAAGLSLLVLTMLQLPAVVAAQDNPPATEAAPVEPTPQPDPVYKLEDLLTRIPEVDELLNGKALDWIVMTNDDVYVVESVVPRPQTLEKRRLEVEKKNEERRVAAAEDRPKIIEELADLSFLYVSLPDVDGNPERRLPITLIKELIHHEDLMIRRAIMLLEEKQPDKAFELLLRLKRNWNSWPGYDAAFNLFLLTDGITRLEAQNPSAALTVLRELYSRDKNFTGLAERYGEAIESLVQTSVAEDDYRRATFHLNELTSRFPGHPVFQKYDAQFTAQVNQLIAEADTAAAAGDFRTATRKVEEGARIWPRTPALGVAFRKHSSRYQRLHVGVLNLPEEGKAYFLPAPADRRMQTLTTLSLFEVNRLRDGTAYYRTRFLDEWEPYDLGRRMKFTLRKFRQPADMHDVIGSPDIVTQLLRRMSPEHPDYDERLASYIGNITVHSPLEFTLEFRRVPPRIEPLLAGIQFTGQLQEVADEGTVDSTLIGPLTNAGGFVKVDALANRYAVARSLPEPVGLPAYHVAEVVERRYDNSEQAMQGLLRGEVAMLTDVPSWEIRRIQEDETFLQSYEVRQLTMPLTQVLQFNPQTRVLRTRELRRGLAYSINRERLLKEVILKDDAMQHGRIVTGPFFSNSTSRDLLIEPRRYDVTSGIAMVVAAKKILTASKAIENEQLPRLRFVVEPGAIQEEVARDMARIWNKIGVPVDVVLGTEPNSGNWDIMFRSLQMQEPLVEIWPFLTVSNRAQLSDLDDYPDWLKQEIVDLDRTSDQTRAVDRMHELHRHLWDDAALVPLWELDQFQVARKSIAGVPAKPLHLYDNLDHWSVDPWFPAE